MNNHCLYTQKHIKPTNSVDKQPKNVEKTSIFQVLYTTNTLRINISVEM
jgi:hypothetical protein